MNKKWFLIVSSIVLSVMFLGGCNTNDPDPPPPENQDMIENSEMNNGNGGSDQNNIPDPVNYPLDQERNERLRDQRYEMNREYMEPIIDDRDGIESKVKPLG